MQTTEIMSMKISEVAKELEVSPSRLRNWCDKGLVNSTTGKNNTKMISTEELPKIKRIVEILDSSTKRISLDEVKEMLYQENYEFVEDLLDEVALEAAIEKQPETKKANASKVAKVGAVSVSNEEIQETKNVSKEVPKINAVASKEEILEAKAVVEEVQETKYVGKEAVTTSSTQPVTTFKNTKTSKQVRNANKKRKKRLAKKIAKRLAI